MLGFLKRAPDFLILGAQKAGTSSLEFFLGRHPRIRCAHTKEVGFFSRDRMYHQGAAWYARQFPRRLRPGIQLFEATPEYLYYPFVAERIARFNPRLKLIVLLRNPVERAFSAWNMFRQMHADAAIRDQTIKQYIEEANAEAREPILELLGRKEFPDFDACVECELNALRRGTARALEPSFVRRGLYHEQVQRFGQYFPPESLLILESAELKQDRAGAVNRVLAFLGLAAADWPQTALQDQHVRQYDVAMAESTRTALQKFYEEPNARLYSAIGRAFDWDRAPARPASKAD
jgi:Sulfotransferase domain